MLRRQTGNAPRRKLMVAEGHSSRGLLCLASPARVHIMERHPKSPDPAVAALRGLTMQLALRLGARQQRTAPGANGILAAALAGLAAAIERAVGLTTHCAALGTIATLRARLRGVRRADHCTLGLLARVPALRTQQLPAFGDALRGLAHWPAIGVARGEAAVPDALGVALPAGVGPWQRGRVGQLVHALCVLGEEIGGPGQAERTRGRMVEVSPHPQQAAAGRPRGAGRPRERCQGSSSHGKPGPGHLVRLPRLAHARLVLHSPGRDQATPQHARALMGGSTCSA
mmetsp:Transcript_123088/g.342827  ORF Transcript_123088/g.342827 Transcript_123088/m.342827 type:complete len:285 (-) Transcript_123088:7-861(-)